MKNLTTKLLAACAAVLSVCGVLANDEPWQYDAAAQTISDGVWTLVVTNTVDRELVIGPGTSHRSDGRETPPWAFLADYTAPEGGADLDLSKPVYTKGDEGEAWKIVQMTAKCFGSAKGIASVVMPKTLVKLDSQTFNSVDSLTNVVYDCPLLEGNATPHGWDFGSSLVARFVLNVPKATGLTGPNFNGASFLDTDLSTWDVSNVQTIDANALKAGYAYQEWKTPDGGIGPKGDLNLPNVQTIGETALMNWMRVSSVSFGTEGTLKSLGSKIFWNSTYGEGKRYVASVGPSKIDFGKSYNFTVDAEAFLSCGDDIPVPVKEFWFASKAPSVANIDNLLAFRTVGDDGAKPVKIFVPMYEETWQAVCSPLTDEEKTLAAEETVEGGEIVGVYEMQDGRRVAWLVNRSDLVEPSWEYDAAAGTITDGYWTLAVSPTGNAGELKVTASSDLLTNDLSGQIDLSRSVFTKGSVGVESARWKIVEIEARAFRGAAAKLTSFYAPKTLKTWGSQVFRDVSSLVEVVIDCPELEGSFGQEGGEFGTSNVRRFVFKAPKLEVVGNTNNNNQNRNFASCEFDDTDVSEWDLTGLKTIWAYGLQASRWECTTLIAGGPKGDLNLPNVVYVGKGAFDSYTRLGTLALGTNGTLEYIGETIAWNPAFNNSHNSDKANINVADGPTKLDFGMSYNFTVHPQAFYAELPNKSGSGLGIRMPIQEVWFSDKAPSIETLDRILVLQTVAEDGTKPVKIFAPMGQRTWKNVCSDFTEDEAVQAEALRKEGYNVIGVYETTGTDDQPKVRCAWLVQNPNFELITGFTIRIR